MPDRLDRPSGSELHLRRFDRQDIEAVLRIERDSFPRDPYPERLFLLLARQSPDLFLVAERQGRLLGYAVGAIDGSATGRIVSIAVEPSSRREGTGRQLSEELLRRFDAAGTDRVLLESRVDNEPAIALWRKLGFEVLGILPGYYSDGTDALLMRRA